MTHWLNKIIRLFETDTADLRELARIAGGNPKTFYRGIKIEDLDLNGQDIDGMEFDTETSNYVQYVSDSGQGPVMPLHTAIQNISSAANQEERLALLLKLILKNRSRAIQVINAYGTDKAKYANGVLREIKIMFSNETAVGTLQTRDLAHVLWYPFSRGMPGNRALMLLFMAKHLAFDRQINQFLTTRLANSYSMFIEPKREQIQEYLNVKYDERA